MMTCQKKNQIIFSCWNERQLYRQDRDKRSWWIRT